MTSAGLLGVWGKWVKHAKYIYNIQDFNPEQVLAVGYTKSKFVTDAMMWFDKFSCKRSDLIITVGRDLVETVEGRFKGKKAPKTVMINNWIDENEIYPLDENNEKVLAFKKKYGLDGLKRERTEQQMRDAIAKGTLMKDLQWVPVKKDDLFFIEAGTIHAIGAGALVAEIQENSNLTYRLYDYDRVGKDGKKRELHIDKALDVANLKSSAEPKQPLRVLKYRQGIASELLTRCKYFEVYRMIVNTERRQKVHYRADEIAFRVHDLRDVQLLCHQGHQPAGQAGGAVQDLRLLSEHPAQL